MIGAKERPVEIGCDQANQESILADRAAGAAA
jgi:hypothetical protein